MFGEQLGLSTERLVHVDTLLFWVTGTYHYYQPLNPGQQVSIHTWLERIARIRVYIRQEIRTADGAELLGASREEHLVVSLSEARAEALAIRIGDPSASLRRVPGLNTLRFSRSEQQ